MNPDRLGLNMSSSLASVYKCDNAISSMSVYAACIRCIWLMCVHASQM